MSVEFEPLLIEPAYRKVAAAIGARILSRALREGERLPPETELARQFGVNRSTVREALRELESRGLVQRRPGSKLMSVSRPQHARGRRGREPRPAAARCDGARRVGGAHAFSSRRWRRPRRARAPRQDLERHQRGGAGASAPPRRTPSRRCIAPRKFFRCLGRATHNPVLGLAQEPLLQLLEPSLRVMIDKVPQARSRIATAQRRLVEALEARDADGAHAGWRGTSAISAAATRSPASTWSCA